MSTVYPILAANPPYTPAIKEEKKIIEEKEAERRKRVVRGSSLSLRGSPNDLDEWWSMEKVESFYKECCAGREENADHTISAAFKVSLTVLVSFCILGLV
jgi:protein phosphatase 1 regulatory subunit 37